VTPPILHVVVASEHDVVLARQRARQISAGLGFDPQDQTRIATAVSEIARNAFRYAGGGRIEFAVEGAGAAQALSIRAIDRGPGIRDLDAILGGTYRSTTGMGIGILGARRLMDTLDVSSSAAGTTVTMRKTVPARAGAVGRAVLAAIADAVAREGALDPLAEVQAQNQELLRTLDELRRRQEELARMNRELEDTNRGVVALYAELDEKADHLRRADELKSRFLSHMSHEFRTPLNSILALSRLLLGRADGDLTEEQERQVGFIRKAAQDLFELVDDLLDLAKVEAGKIVVRPAEFRVEHLFGALRGMLSPLLVNPALALVFEDASALPPVQSDESKVSQILRNLISNALKFTERGEIRVTARMSADGGAVVFSVRDTGIGIAPEDQALIFQDFTQLDNRLQRRVRGTGLGLPLSRRLAELLGGGIAVESAPGVGSVFTLTIPLVHVPADTRAAAEEQRAVVEWEPDPSLGVVLVVDDDAEAVRRYRGHVSGSAYQIVAARDVADARRLLQEIRPRAVVVDPAAGGGQGWAFLEELRLDEATAHLPVLVVSAADAGERARLLGAAAVARKPVDRAWLGETLRAVAGVRQGKRILIVDDDDAARYLLRTLFRGGFVVREAGDGQEGLELARALRPDLIVCDLLMPRMSGLEMIVALREDPATRGIPVVVSTVKGLAPEESAELERRGIPVLAKQAFTAGTAARDLRRILGATGIAS